MGNHGGAQMALHRLQESHHIPQFHLRGFQKVCLAGKLLLIIYDGLVKGDQQVPASGHGEKATLAGRLAYDCVIATNSVREHWLPVVLIFVHSDVQVQCTELHGHRNRMRINSWDVEP